MLPPSKSQDEKRGRLLEGVARHAVGLRRGAESGGASSYLKEVSTHESNVSRTPTSSNDLIQE